MAEERRPGDWLHKSQRTHEQANTIVTDEGAPKWHKQTFWIVFFLLMFWPVGLVLLWRSTWPVPAKIIITIVLLIMVWFVFSAWSALQASGYLS